MMNGKTVADIKLPEDSLITPIARNEDFIVPSGKTSIETGDILLIIANNNNAQEVQSLVNKKQEAE